MTRKGRPGQRGDTNHCRFVMEDGSLCGATHRCSNTHRPGMTRAQHEEGAIHYTRQQQPPSRGEPTGHVPVSGEQRAQNASVREELVGGVITQPGRFYGARVQEHIRGSQYRVLLRENLGGNHSEPFYASHTAQTSYPTGYQLTLGQRLGIGWSEWEDRTDDLKTDESEEDPMDAMDAAVADSVAQEREAATMAPPTPLSDPQTLRVELLGARLEDNRLWAVFQVGDDLFYGPLSKFDPLDLIRGDE